MWPNGPKKKIADPCTWFICKSLNFESGLVCLNFFNPVFSLFIYDVANLINCWRHALTSPKAHSFQFKALPFFLCNQESSENLLQFYSFFWAICFIHFSLAFLGLWMVNQDQGQVREDSQVRFLNTQWKGYFDFFAQKMETKTFNGDFCAWRLFVLQLLLF